MSVFLGIGLGPIQTGIFLSGAAKSNFSRLVIAEVDKKLGAAVKNSGGKITINIAAADKIYHETIKRIEIYNPLCEEELKLLIEAAGEASEIATALPSVDFFPKIAGWLKEGFSQKPDLLRFVYTAENNNHAAEILKENIGPGYSNTHFLNTVVGKMSGVFPADGAEKSEKVPLCNGAGRGHLVEEFNKILISSAPDIERRKVQGLYVKDDLYPFEEAKLYGHNAIHFLLGMLGREKGKQFMSELSACKDLMKFAETAFVEESGRALCRKWKGVDELFTESGFREYVMELMQRMVNPFLNDPVERITRDLERKLGWNDRVIGTMRLVISQNINPEKLAYGAALAASELFGKNKGKISAGFKKIWPKPWTDENEAVLKLISKSNIIS